MKQNNLYRCLFLVEIWHTVRDSSIWKLADAHIYREAILKRRNIRSYLSGTLIELNTQDWNPTFLFGDVRVISTEAWTIFILLLGYWLSLLWWVCIQKCVFCFTRLRRASCRFVMLLLSLSIMFVSVSIKLSVRNWRGSVEDKSDVRLSYCLKEIFFD